MIKRVIVLVAVLTAHQWLCEAVCSSGCVDPNHILRFSGFLLMPNCLSLRAVVGLPMAAGNITVRGGQHRQTATIRGSSGLPNAMDNINATTTVCKCCSSRGNDRAQVPPPSSISTSTQAQSTQTPVLAPPPREEYLPLHRKRMCFHWWSDSRLCRVRRRRILLNLPPRLPSEIQYWAGVIMWNAFGSVRIVSVFLMIVGLLSLLRFVVFL